MRFCLILLFSLTFITLCETASFLRLTRIICQISRITIPEQPDCFIKTYKKRSYFTVRFNTTRKSPNLQLNYKSSRKSADVYSRILEFKDLEICKIFQTKKFSFIGIFHSIFEETLKLIGGDVFEVCTKKEGEKIVKNVTFSDMTAVFETFPPGDYLNIFHFFDKNDPNVINVSLYSQWIKK